MKSFLFRFWKWIAVGTIFVIALFGWTRYNSAKQTASLIGTAKVARMDFVKAISSSGKTADDTSVDLKFQTSGKLAWVGVKEGDAVRKGQVIASLDQREVQKTLQKDLNTYMTQRWTFDQTHQDNQGQIVTDAMKRILDKSQFALDNTVLDVELQNLAIEFSNLTSPIDGIVTHIDTPVAGVNITPAAAVFTVADPKSLVFTANVDETDVGSLSLGQPATITLDAFPEATFSGKVSYISYSSELSSGGATVFPVKVLFDAPANLRIGLNGDISIIVDRQTDVLTIPTSAIREDTSATYVYRKTKTGYQKTAVTLGARNDTDAVVTSGLSNGDSVVIKGFSSIPK